MIATGRCTLLISSSVYWILIGCTLRLTGRAGIGALVNCQKLRIKRADRVSDSESRQKHSELTNRIGTVILAGAARRTLGEMPQPCSARKGTLRRAKTRRALAACARLWLDDSCDGRLRQDHSRESFTFCKKNVSTGQT